MIILYLVIGIIAWNVLVQGVRMYQRHQEAKRNNRNRLNELMNSLQYTGKY